MICKLCLQDKPLIKRSHIVPNFMYGDLFDEKHSFIKVNFPNWSGKKLYTGEYESNIFCKKCDNEILGALENYARRVLYGGRITGIDVRNEVNQNGVEFTYAKGIDYKKFKLFLLSILWRCSISKRDFYKQINLKPGDEEAIRQMIYKGNPGKQMEYPCFISSYRKHEVLPMQVMSQPTKSNHNGETTFSMLIGGVLYMYFILKHSMPKEISETAINENGELRIVHIPIDQAKKLLNYYWQQKFF